MPNVKRGKVAQDDVPDVAGMHPSSPTSEATADHRPDVYVDIDAATDINNPWPTDEITGMVGPVVYRLSRVMSCRKALAAVRLSIEGDDAPPWLQERYEEGTLAEADILAMVFGDPKIRPTGGCPGGDWKLLDPGDRASYKIANGESKMFPYVKPGTDSGGTGQFVAEIPIGKGKIARGHLDGIAQLYGSIDGFWTVGMRAVVEVKYLATAAFRQWKADYQKQFERNGSYAGQISGYMYATGLGALYVVAEKIVHEADGVRRVSVGEIYTFYLGPDEAPMSIGKLKAQVASVEKRAMDGQLGECGEEMWPCPIWFLHTGEGRDENSQVEADVPDEMTETFVDGVSRYQRGMVKEREGKAEKAAGKEILEKVAAEVGVGGTGGKMKSAVGDVEWVVEDVKGGMVERKGYRKAYPKIGKAWRGEGESTNVEGAEQ